MLNMLTFFNKCAENIVQMFGVHKIKSKTSGKLSFYLYFFVFSTLAWTVVILILLFLTDLFSLNVINSFNPDVVYLSGKVFGRNDSFGKRAARSVHFDIPEGSNSSSEDASGPNFTIPTAASAEGELRAESQAVWERLCTEVQEKVHKGTLPQKTEEAIRSLLEFRYNVEMTRLEMTRSANAVLKSQGFTEVYKPTKFCSTMFSNRVKKVISKSESLELQIKLAAESEIKRACEKHELGLKLEDEARENRLQQAAVAGAVRRFDLRSYLSKENTARHHFAGATNRNRASMHPKAEWPYDGSNNYIPYKGFTAPANNGGGGTSAETNTEFTQEFEKKDPFIHKSSSNGGDETPSDEGSSNIPEAGDKSFLIKKLVGFVLHLAPHWVDINTPQGKFLLVLFSIIGLILIILGLKYLYHKFIQPLFNKKSKDFNKLRDKKDTKL